MKRQLGRYVVAVARCGPGLHDEEPGVFQTGVLQTG